MIQSQGGTPNVRSARYAGESRLSFALPSPPPRRIRAHSPPHLAGPLAWHEGGPLPEDVYSWKDVQRGVSKLFKRVKGSSASGASNGSAPSVSSDNGDADSVSIDPGEGAAFRGRSLSTTSTTSSSGSADEARRMEREAKGKNRIEHIEEAVEEELPEDEREDIPATVDDDDEEEDGTGPGGRPRFGGDEDEDDETSASEVTAPRTPPDGLLNGAAGARQGGGGGGGADGDLDVERRRVLKGKGVDDAEHRGVQVAS